MEMFSLDPTTPLPIMIVEDDITIRLQLKIFRLFSRLFVRADGCEMTVFTAYIAEAVALPKPLDGLL